MLCSEPHLVPLKSIIPAIPRIPPLRCFVMHFCIHSMHYFTCKKIQSRLYLYSEGTFFGIAGALPRKGLKQGECYDHNQPQT